MIGILSLIFGIVGIFTSFFYVGIFLCIVGLTLGIVGLTDCFSEKNFPLAGLLLSILGMILSVYTVVSDIDSNKLIIIYSDDEKIYLSNYKDVISAFDEIEALFLDDSENTFSDEEIFPTNVEQMTDANIAGDEPIRLYEPIDSRTEDTYESVAIQPDKDWYLQGGYDTDKTAEDYQEPIDEQQSNLKDEFPASTTNDVSEGVNSSDTVEITYVLNHNTMKFHKPDCYSASTIKSENREDTTLSREDVTGLGYGACQKCKP